MTPKVFIQENQFKRKKLVELNAWCRNPWAFASPRPHAMLSFQRKPVRIGLERLFHLVIQGLTRSDWFSPNDGEQLTHNFAHIGTHITVAYF
ncbi:hypothetical protein JOQ06_015649 [Pogonophryne albipinna]|uniref:Uncharacterized protein n=1 Tax=Pogonophryne albipinna TaxID=1090488 RepID=A0AAD6ANG4_9TELE|nr:hypothetical protein JOQ06_015649 [Pogonophryne albipinna]